MNPATLLALENILELIVKAGEAYLALKNGTAKPEDVFNALASHATVQAANHAAFAAGEDAKFGKATPAP